MLKRIIVSTARRLGYHIVAESGLDARSQATFCRKLFASLGIDFVFDVGAYRGQYRAFIRDAVRFAGRGISFEPVPEFAADARRAAATDTRWAIEQVALGSSPSRTAFNVMVGGDFSSFLTPSHAAYRGFTHNNVVGRRIEVDVRRLDDLFPGLQRTYGFERPFLKLDTQGFDLEILRGATASLRAIAAVQTELSWIPIYDGMPPASDVIGFLNQAGFRPAGMYRTGPPGYPTAMLESDAYFVRSTAGPTG